MFNKRDIKVIILSGKAESGKDKVADIIKSKLKKCVKVSYAFYLKMYAKNIIDYKEENKDRSFLQSLGIDLISKIDSEFLIKRVIDDINIYSYFFDYVIITDARLVKEILIPKERFNHVYTVRIKRDLDNSLTDEQKNHITETDLDDFVFDYVINNDFNLDKNIDEVIKCIM